MSRVEKLQDMLDEVLDLCEKYKNNFEILQKLTKEEREAANKIITTQKALIKAQQEGIRLLEKKVRLLEGRE